MSADNKKYFEIIPWEVATEVSCDFAASEPRWKAIIETELQAIAKSKSGAIAIELEKMTVDDSNPESILCVAIYNVKIPLYNADISSIPD